MYEEYYESIPDVDKYLERIGMERPTQLNKEYLDRLTYSHQKTVPFENLNPYYYKIPAVLTPKELYEKVVVARRGGYCFELNGIYVQLLKDLGFDAYTCPCRIVMGGDNNRPVSHRGNIVTINGVKHFCDVGFGGPSPEGSVEMIEGKRQQVQNEIYWFEKYKPYWWLLMREVENLAEAVGMCGMPPTEKVQSVLLVSEALWEPFDFISLNDAFSAGPEARFGQRLNLNIKKEDGHASLSHNKLTVKTGGVKESKEIDIDDIEVLKEALLEHFGIVL